MSKQIQDAYIVAATRLPVGKRNGAYATTRPDDMLAAALNGALAQAPGLDPARIEDVIAGCAMPEAEQGMNVARIGLLLAGLPQSVAGVTVNRFCASGLQAVADAAARIRTGEADIMIGAGTESMSAMPQIMGNKVSMNPAIFAHEENLGMAFGMGLTGEKVAERWKVSREDQDAFALASHQKACAAIAAGHFRPRPRPSRWCRTCPTPTARCAWRAGWSRRTKARAPTAARNRWPLRPVFAARGSVTAGNSSQMSDGAAAVILVSDRILRELTCNRWRASSASPWPACRPRSWASGRWPRSRRCWSAAASRRMRWTGSN